MVRLAGFSALNSDRDKGHEALQQTLEAQEAGVIQQYEHALRAVQLGDGRAAEVLFGQILEDHLVTSGATEQLQRIRFLSLKNLAGVVATDTARSQEALHLFRQASDADGSDVALWDRYGTLAAQSGEWAVAKAALQQALILEPGHPTLGDKLLQLLIHVGDCAGATSFAKAYLDQRPSHSLAKSVVLNGAEPATPALGAVRLQLPSPGLNAQEQAVDLLASTPDVVVALKQPTWACLMEQCAQLLGDAEYATACVRFEAPIDLVVHNAVGALEPSVAGTNQEAAAPKSALPEGVVEASVQQEVVQLAEQQGVASAAAVPTVLPVETPAAAVAVDQTEAGAPTETEAEPEKEKEQRRLSARSTRGRHTKHTPKETLAASAAAPEPEEEEDPLYLLHTLGPLLCPLSADLLIEDAAGATTKKTSTAGDTAASSPCFGSVAQAQDLQNSGILVDPVPLPSTSAGLVVRWSQREAAAQLLSGGGNGVDALLHLAAELTKQQWRGNEVPPGNCLTLGELYVDAFAQKARKHAGNAASGPNNQPLPANGVKQLPSADLHRYAMLWLSRFRASQVSTAESNDTCEDSVRYWWARGRLHEASSQAKQAAACLHSCAGTLEQSALDDITLAHCRLDSEISSASITGKLEVLQLHEVLALARRLAGEGQHLEASEALTPVLLSCCPREAVMAAIDRKTWLAALRTLLKESLHIKDCVLALRCHLRLLRAGLPPVPKVLHTAMHKTDDNEATPPSAEVDACSTIDIEHLASSGALPDLAAAADFLLSNASSLRNVYDDPETLHEAEWRSLRVVQRQLLAMVHCCGAALKSAGDPRSALSTRATTLRLTMADSAITALELWMLDSGATHTQEATLDWAYDLSAALGDASALLQRHGAFPAALLPVLRDALEKARAYKSSSAELKTSFESGLYHCIFWLYGLHVDAMDEEIWGGALRDEDVPADGARQLSTQHQGLEVWPLVQKFLLQQSFAVLTLTKMTPIINFINKMAALFPAPPAALGMLADQVWTKLATQDPPEVCAPGITNPMEGLLEKGLVTLQTALDAGATGAPSAPQPEGQTPAAPAAADADVPAPPIESKASPEPSIDDWSCYLEVYHSLFQLHSRVQPKLATIVKGSTMCPNGMLDAAADGVVDSLLAPHRHDLLFNPRDYGGWSYLAMAYHEAADLLIRAAAEGVPTAQWRHRADLHRRLDRWRRLGHWCAAVGAITAPTEEDKAAMLELVGWKLFESIQNASPAYDHLKTLPQRDDPALLERCSAALRAFRAAQEILPDEWSYQMQIGRCLRRLNRPAEEYLPHLALACHLATKYHSGLLDSVYTLHAARLKLLFRLDHSASKEEVQGILQLVGRYCFSRETQATMAALCPSEDVGSEPWSAEVVAQVRTALFADGVAAMEYCLEKDKYFHRASTMLAKLHRDDHTAVLTHLLPLFKPKTAFTINMHQIFARAVDGGRSGGKSGSRRKTAAAGANADPGALASPATGEEHDGAGSADVPETAYGFCPPSRKVGIGFSESDVTYNARLRKALLQFLDLQVRCGGVDMLFSACENFKSDDWRHPGYEDLRTIAKGQCTLGLLLAVMKMCPLEALAPPDEMTPGETHAALPTTSSSGSPTDPRVQQRLHLRNVALTQLDAETAKPLLDRAYSLWTRHGMMTREGNASWTTGVVLPARFALSLADSRPLPEADTLAALLQGVSSQVVLQTYVELYVQLLVATGAVDKLRELLIKQRTVFSSTQLPENAKWLLELLGESLVETLRNEHALLLKEVEELELGPLPSPPPAPAPAQPVVAALPVPQAPVIAPPAPHIIQPLPLQRPLAPPPLATFGPEVQTLIQTRAAVIFKNEIARLAVGTQVLPDVVLQHVFQQCLASATMQIAQFLGTPAQVPQVPLVPQVPQQPAVPAVPVPAPQPPQEIGPPAILLSPEEASLLNRVVEALKSIQTVLRGLPYVHSEQLAPPKVRTAVEDLQLDLFKARAKIMRETDKVATLDRRQALADCGDMLKKHKRQSEAAGQTVQPPKAPQQQQHQGSGGLVSTMPISTDASRKRDWPGSSMVAAAQGGAALFENPAKQQRVDLTAEEFSVAAQAEPMDIVGALLGADSGRSEAWGAIRTAVWDLGARGGPAASVSGIADMLLWEGVAASDEEIMGVLKELEAQEKLTLDGENFSLSS